MLEVWVKCPIPGIFSDTCFTTLTAVAGYGFLSVVSVRYLKTGCRLDHQT